jgi:A/G-specific adenine glycosylase
VLVSEVMLQQTPVVRVLPAYAAWRQRWPTPSALAAEPSGQAVRQWGSLGYPRRALALHAAARAICTRWDGVVPRELDALMALPGVGAYTARAVAVFGFRDRHPVVDTNVRRVIARHQRGEDPARGTATAADRDLLAGLLPATPASAARTSVALMELGALVCTARRPSCARCPIAVDCAWRRAGSPPRAPRRAPGYAGTDRQARGRLLGAVRDAAQPVHARMLARVWSDDAQRTRALASLVTDGLLREMRGNRYALPS